MRGRAWLVWLLALVWAGGSWWWYTCKIKGFCELDGLLPASTSALLAKQDSEDSSEEGAEALVQVDTDALDMAILPDIDDEKRSAPALAEEISASQSDDTDQVVWNREDADGDGVKNGEEKSRGTNHLRLDSDNDGIPDPIELAANKDTDNDGVLDALDEDDDGDGIPTSQEGADPNGDGNVDDAKDSDNDGTPDYLQANVENAEESNSSRDGGEVTEAVEVSESEESASVTSGQQADDEKDSEISGVHADSSSSEEQGNESAVVSQESVDQENADSDTDAFEDNGARLTRQPDTGTSDEIQETPDTITTSSTDADTEESSQTDQAEASDNIQAGSETADKAETKAEDGREEPVQNEKPSDTEMTLADMEENQGSTDKKAQSVIRPVRLYFPFRSTNPELSEATADYFDKVIAELKRNPKQYIRLTGHTDSVGRGASNRRLGMQRAQQLRDVMVKRGAPEAQIQVTSAGESQPIADNQLGEGRRLNRRVELVPISEGEMEEESQ